MPYAEPYVYLRALGTFGAAAADNLEQWGVGFKFRNPGTAPSPANIDAFVESAVAPLSAFHAKNEVGAGTACFLTEVTGAYVGTDGKYVGGALQDTQRSVLGTPTAGKFGTGAPWTQALVISLRTPLGRGPGSNGRVYYPCLGLAIGAGTGVLAPATTSAYATAAQILINALNAAADANLPGTGGLSVMSQVGTGVAATVTSIRIGSKLDRQESRERGLTEAYAPATITTVAAFVAPNRTSPLGS